MVKTGILEKGEYDDGTYTDEAIRDAADTVDGIPVFYESTMSFSPDDVIGRVEDHSVEDGVLVVEATIEDSDIRSRVEAGKLTIVPSMIMDSTNPYSNIDVQNLFCTPCPEDGVPGLMR